MTTLDIPIDVMKAILASTLTTASTDQARPAMNVIHFEVLGTPQSLRIESTDSYVLTRLDTDDYVAKVDDTTVLNLYRADAEILLQTLKAYAYTSDVHVVIEISGRKVIVQIQGGHREITMNFTQDDIAFPPVSKVLDDPGIKDEGVATFNLAILFKAVEVFRVPQAAQVSTGTRSDHDVRRVRMEISPDKQGRLTGKLGGFDNIDATMLVMPVRVS